MDRLGEQGGNLAEGGFEALADGRVIMLLAIGGFFRRILFAEGLERDAKSLEQ